MSVARACSTGLDPRSTCWSSPCQSMAIPAEQCKTQRREQVGITHCWLPSPTSPFTLTCKIWRWAYTWSRSLNIPESPKVQRKFSCSLGYSQPGLEDFIRDPYWVRDKKHLSSSVPLKPSEPDTRWMSFFLQHSEWKLAASKDES